MGQLIVLNLGQGDCQQGFPLVTAQLGQEMQVTGSLPPVPELPLLYQRWQQFYAALYAHKSWRQGRSSGSGGGQSLFELEPEETCITDVSEVAFHALCRELQDCLNRWLNTDTFRPIDRQVRTRLTPGDEIRCLITAQNREVLRLPWSLWQWLDDYPRAELALSLPDYTQTAPIPRSSSTTVHILVILGDHRGINIEQDRALLSHLPETTLTFLVEPTIEQLNDQLWKTHWDMLFFAGHSSSQATGKIYLNATDSLTIPQLRFALKKAIERGLKLAIFNSCDGLGLAWDLADLHLPQVIVMREPVPDRVAHAFLKSFLAAFSAGQSFYLAVREAREYLQGLEQDFPCAAWLPIICQNPAEQPPTWNTWVHRDLPTPHSPLPTPHSPLPALHFAIHPFRRLLLSSLLITGLVLAVRSLGLLQPLELWTYDRLLAVRPQESPDTRFLIVTISEADLQAQGSEPRRGSLSDRAFLQLLERLEQAKPRVIGLDIYRDFPTGAASSPLIRQLRENSRLVVICKSSDTKYDPTGIAPPPEVNIDQVGFSDFIEDRDGILRRHLLWHSPDPASPCTTPYAFNLQIAFRYLQTEGIKPEFTPEGNLKLGTVVFPRLHSRTGGYQGIDAAGNQILLNYRSLPALQAIAPQVSLTQVLQGKVQPEAIKDRIVLIGTTANSSGDFWTTPYGMRTADRVAGVFLQAHMTSQVISAVLDKRPLIWVWNGMGEAIWISGWAMLGGGWAVLGKRSRWRGAILILSWIGLTGICAGLLVVGGWIPLVPAAITLLGTGGTIWYQNRQSQGR